MKPTSAEASDRGGADVLGPVLTRLITGALVAVALAAILGWLFLAVSHLQDRYEVGHVQGAWMGLEQYANEGTLYPPLFDGVHYGGTRWMPLPILLNATAARITGEYLVSGKLVGLVLTAGLLVLVFFALRRFETPKELAAALAATVVATDTGRIAGTTLGGDVLPVLLQVGALVVATSGRKKRSLVVAGVLAGLALASKTTGVWAALALFTWLGLDRRWRDLAFFGAAFGVTTAVVLGAVELVSSGRFSDNLVVLTFAGVGGGVGPIRAPNQVLYQLATFGPAVWALVPFAAAGALIAPLRRISVYHLALGWAFLLLLGTYTDVGAGFNQLLDVTVLTVLAVGHLAGRLDVSRLRTPMATILALVVIWGTTTGIVLTLVPDIRATVEGASLGYPLHPLTGLVGPTDEILSEDPYVPLSLGRKPVVLDPFMLRRLDIVDPAAVDVLIGRIENHEFAYIVTVVPLTALDGDTVDNNYWWNNFHFGLRVVGAMRRAYVMQGVVDGYYVYRPGP
ncbi:MAG: hypothetical protein M3P11_13375 [Actinomycetota bacterium]|nr:hypothetical protein [Actinomycetota bacterium]